MSPDCTFTIKTDGLPTNKEKKCLQKIQDDRKAARESTIVGTTGTTLVKIDDLVENWEDQLDAEDYGFSFNIVASLKEIVVENLKGQDRHAFNQCQSHINIYWILLDNQSTVHVFFDVHFLVNVRKVNKELHLYTNSGMSVIDEVGELPGFGTVWVHRKGIANFLSFNGVKDAAGYQIQYDNFVEDAFNVTKPNGKARKYIPSKK